MKLMEHFCKKQRGIVVQNKGKQKRQKKPKSNISILFLDISFDILRLCIKFILITESAPSKNSVTDAPQSNEELWDVVAPQLSVVIATGTIPDDIIPFDAASEKDIEDQR